MKKSVYFKKSDPSTAIQRSIVDTMRVLRMISIEKADPPDFLLWAKNVFFRYPWPSRRQLIHIVFDNCSLPEDPTKVLSMRRVDRGYEM